MSLFNGGTFKILFYTIIHVRLTYYLTFFLFLNYMFFILSRLAILNTNLYNYYFKDTFITVLVLRVMLFMIFTDWFSLRNI